MKTTIFLLGLALWQAALGTGNAMGGLKIIDRLQQGQPGREKYQKYVCDIFSPKLRTLGWDEKMDEPTETRQLRALIIETLGFFGDRDVIDRAFGLFEKYRQNPKTLAPNLRAPVMLIVGRYSSDLTYDQLLSAIPRAATIEEKQLLLRAISIPLDPGLVNRTLNYLLTNSESIATATQAFESLAIQGEHPEIAWEFATSRLKEMQNRFGALRRDRLISMCASGFEDEKRASDVIDFFRSNLAQDTMPLAEKAAELIRFRAKLKARELPGIDKWLETKSGTVARRGGG